MPKPTIIYIVWVIITSILLKLKKFTDKLYWYSNSKALRHSPAIRWLFAGVLHK